MMRYFWEAAIAQSPQNARFDQAERFPLCQPGPLQALFERHQLKSVTVQPLDIPTIFRSFDDYWQPFLGKTGPAPTYLASLSDDARQRIRMTLEFAACAGAGPPHRAERQGLGSQGDRLSQETGYIL